MSDGNGSKGTSLAITEKRHGNNGGGGRGCAGILFQLFDWHRRFAKKKIFKRRLLPHPARAKQVVQKFKGIADDNKGGFPITRKNMSRNLDAGQEIGIIQAPGLVARLMGLESMPLVQKKLRKTFQRDLKQEKVVRRSRVVEKEDIIVEKGETEHGSRFPKTRESDRRMVTQIGAEALQIKKVLSRSTKHRCQNFSTLVKSPRIAPGHRSSSVTSSRLIDAATKILEPGLQNKNRINCALPYSSIMQAASAETLTQRSWFLSSDMLRRNLGSECLTNKLSMKQSSCKNCGHMLENSSDCGQNKLEQKLNHFDIAPWHLDNLHHKHVWVAPSTGDSPAEDHNDRPVKEVKPCKEYRDGCPLSRHQSKSHWDEMPAQEIFMPDSRNSYSKGGRIPCSLSSFDYYKDFLNLNGRMSSRTYLRSPTRANSSRDDVERTHTRKSGSTSEMKSPLRKMRSSSEHRSSASTAYTKQKSRSTSRCIETGNGVVSFTFHSNVRDKIGFSDEVKHNIQEQNDFNEKKYSESKSELGDNYLSQLQQKHFDLTGDALGATLEKKLKELTSQDQEEDIISREMPGRPPTMILQELIAAVAAEPSVLKYGVMANSKTDFQMKLTTGDAPKGFPDMNSFSPGSVLEASFSNDNCISSSFDDISGSIIHTNLTYYSIDSLAHLVPDMEFLDSATSSNMGSTHFVELTSLIDRLDGMMDSLILAEVSLSGSEVNLAKDIILHTELFFASYASENFKYLEDVICILLQDVCTYLKRLFILGDSNMGSEMKVFALDCLLECFDKGYRRFCNIGYSGWERQLSSWSIEMLSRDIVKKVRRWAYLSGLTPDKIIEDDMSNALGKWTNFDVEAFELGAAFADDLLKDAVEDIVVSILSPAC